MRRPTILFLLLALPASGQHLPQWKVAHSVILSNQTNPIPLTTIFTPQAQGVYRLSVYFSGGGGTPAAGDWDMSANWTDLTGAGGDFDELQVNTGDANWTQHTPSLLSIEPDTPLQYEVVSVGNVSGSDYNLVLTVEQLE